MFIALLVMNVFKNYSSTCINIEFVNILYFYMLVNDGINV